MSNDAYSTPDFSVQSCPNRAAGDLGSSLNITTFEFKGFYGTNEKNTYFYKWNRVVIRYCDGGSFAGDVENPDPVTKLYYRGARIFQVVVDELMAKGMKAAKNVIFAGGSAGGLGVLCFQPKNLVQYVKSPLFIVRSAFDSFQVRNTFSMDLYNAIKNHSSVCPNFREQIISALPDSSATKGFIVTSRFGHGFALNYYKTKMLADQNSTTIESAFYDWYFDQRSVNLIDPSNVPYYTN
nr:pectin acetylesterase 8-like [Ipomoea batatas]